MKQNFTVYKDNRKSETSNCGFQDTSTPTYFMYKNIKFKQSSFKTKLKGWLKKVCLKLLS